ncbi:alpha/beta hydrolase [Sphingobium sp. H39-3-25]|uniref:alpha/beta fold hydrolase n=1 Tax=Sphingobium arseniciresistens TaxID=3030834 RepID=UPI0023BA2DAF|nr:alpha/beta hydrolase [Sphingobium arseniciresistens]
MPRPATFHRTAQVEDIELFYREAGQPGSPVIVLLHGFPSSSHMYRNLMPELADRYHVIAPDLPGFGLSAMPPPDRFEYSFAHFARILDGLLVGLGIERHALYVMDYGAPVGFRLALDRPDRITALVVQNGNAYEEGMGPFWDLTRAYWADPGSANRDAMRPFLEPAGTRFQYLTGVQDAERIDPAAWLYDQIFLDRPGSTEIQLDIIYDYRTNVALYPAIHEWLRATRPPTLILWGEDDPIFLAAGARAYLRDVPEAELHYLRTGHFALEERAPEMIPILRDFLARAL